MIKNDYATLTFSDAFSRIAQVGRPVSCELDDDGDWCVCFDGGEWKCDKSFTVAVMRAADTIQAGDT